MLTIVIQNKYLFIYNDIISFSSHRYTSILLGMVP